MLSLLSALVQADVSAAYRVPLEAYFSFVTKDATQRFARGPSNDIDAVMKTCEPLFPEAASAFAGLASNSDIFIEYRASYLRRYGRDVDAVTLFGPRLKEALRKIAAEILRTGKGSFSESFKFTLPDPDKEPPPSVTAPAGDPPVVPPSGSR